MNLNLFRIIIWEDNEPVDKIGIVMGDGFGEAAKNLEEHFDCIEEITYLSPIGNTMVYELDEPGYEHFSYIKDNFIW